MPGRSTAVAALLIKHRFQGRDAHAGVAQEAAKLDFLIAEGGQFAHDEGLTGFDSLAERGQHVVQTLVG